MHVRVRPLPEPSVWASAETVLYSIPNQKLRYVFGKVHPTTSTNTTLFRSIEQLIEASYTGQNVTIMAYGQTGSGKTHSMLGVPSDPGIVPRTAEALIRLRDSHPTGAFQLRLSVMEIYNDSVRDLLDPSCRELRLQDAPNNSTTTDASTVEIVQWDDFTAASNTAQRNRKTGITNLNEHSSRSHMILSFEIRRGVIQSSIRLVDLAGSESASRANTKGLALQEGGHINQSLLTLGNVVTAIIEGRSHIPYRESKLTRLLRSSLGGAGLSYILCCVNPSKSNFDQTNTALQFAQRAMKIKNDPVQDISTMPLLVHRYAQQLGTMSQLGTEHDTALQHGFEEGVRDTFAMAYPILQAVHGEKSEQQSAALARLADAQRALLAHDQARGLQQLEELRREVIASDDGLSSMAHDKRELLRQHSDVRSVAQQAVAELAASEHSHRTMGDEIDMTLAQWEFDHERAMTTAVSELDVLISAEQVDRCDVHQSWLIALKELTKQCAMEARMQVEVERTTVASPVKKATQRSSVMLIEDPSSPMMTSPRAKTHRPFVVTRIMTAQKRKEYEELHASYLMVRDELPPRIRGPIDESLGFLLQGEQPAEQQPTQEGGGRGGEQGGGDAQLEELAAKLRTLGDEQAALVRTIEAEAKQSLSRAVQRTPTSRSPPPRAAAVVVPPPAEQLPAAAVTPPPRSTSTHRPSTALMTPPPAAGRNTVKMLTYVSPYSQQAMRPPLAPMQSNSFLKEAQMEARHVTDRLEEMRARLMKSQRDANGTDENDDDSVVIPPPAKRRRAESPLIQLTLSPTVASVATPNSASSKRGRPPKK